MSNSTVTLRREPPHGPFEKFTTVDRAFEIHRSGAGEKATWSVWQVTVRDGFSSQGRVAGPFTTLAAARSALVQLVGKGKTR